MELCQYQAFTAWQKRLYRIMHNLYYLFKAWWYDTVCVYWQFAHYQTDRLVIQIDINVQYLCLNISKISNRKSREMQQHGTSWVILVIAWLCYWGASVEECLDIKEKVTCRWAVWQVAMSTAVCLFACVRGLGSALAPCYPPIHPCPKQVQALVWSSFWCAVWRFSYMQLFT